MNDVPNATEEIVKKAKSLGADEVIAKTTFGKYRHHVSVTMRLTQL